MKKICILFMSLMFMFFVVCNVYAKFAEPVSTTTQTKKIKVTDGYGRAVSDTTVEINEKGEEKVNTITYEKEEYVPPQIDEEVEEQEPVDRTIIRSTKKEKKDLAIGLTVGDHIAYLKAAGVLAVNKPLDDSVEFGLYSEKYETDTTWGIVGLEVAAGYQYCLFKYFSIGAELNAGGILAKPKEFDDKEVKLSQSTSYIDALLLGHIYLNNIENATRYYIPLGIGLGRLKYSIKDEEYGYCKKTDIYEGSLTYIAGLGIEMQNIGIELRYNNMSTSNSDMNSFSFVTLNFIFGFNL